MRHSSHAAHTPPNSKLTPPARLFRGPALHGVRPLPILNYTCAHPFPDETQDPLICNTVLKKRFQPTVIKLAEKVADIRIEHPIHPFPLNSDRQRIQRVMRATPQWRFLRVLLFSVGA